jgi:hypothetical protein
VGAEAHDEGIFDVVRVVFFEPSAVLPRLAQKFVLSD